MAAAVPYTTTIMEACVRACRKDDVILVVFFFFPCCCYFSRYFPIPRNPRQGGGGVHMLNGDAGNETNHPKARLILTDQAGPKQGPPDSGGPNE